jgi:hypothetical protein
MIIPQDQRLLSPANREPIMSLRLSRLGDLAGQLHHDGSIVISRMVPGSCAANVTMPPARARCSA